ncbi:MAG: hypothetical protein IPH07_39420 [Deltaproteobacteria bacterium]|nr:hypothetical protein [Deltaproteobacteria bacterium]
MLPRSTALLLALALPSACTSPSESTSEGSSSTAVADDSSSTADSTVSATASTTDTTGPTSSTSSMTGSTMSTTDPSSSTGPQGCAGDDECGGPGTPICIDQVCSPCESDAQCAAKDPANPACRDDGQCVQCTASNDDGCGGATPICDAAVNTCMGCAFHEQCPDSACRIATGECFDEADVHTVGAGQDFEDFTAAAGSLGAEMAVLRVASGPTYDEAIVLSGSSAVWAILDANPDDDTLPLWARTSGNTSTLSIDAGAEVYIQGISVSSNTGSSMFPGIAVDNASLYLDRAWVVTNLGGGISLDNGGYALVRNSFVGGVLDIPAVTASDSTLEGFYSSLIGSAGESASVMCNAGATVTVRNSLLLSRADAASDIQCSNASISDSVTEANFPGGSNITTVGVMGATESMSWFAGYASGNFHLTPMAPAAILTAAQWQSGDPLVDIDGDARPGVDGSADVAGADIP